MNVTVGKRSSGTLEILDEIQALLGRCSEAGKSQGSMGCWYIDDDEVDRFGKALVGSVIASPQLGLAGLQNSNHCLSHMHGELGTCILPVHPQYGYRRLEPKVPILNILVAAASNAEWWLTITPP